MILLLSLVTVATLLENNFSDTLRTALGVVVEVYLAKRADSAVEELLFTRHGEIS